MNYATNLTQEMIETSNIFFKFITNPVLGILINPMLSEAEKDEIRDVKHVIPVTFNGLSYDAVVLEFYSNALVNS